jgi:hypothetical protein
MAFPSGSSVTTTNLDSGTGNPAAARNDIYVMAQYVNQIIASENTALGVVTLNGSGQISSSQVPSSLAPSGILTLAPSSGFVKIQDILRLQIIPKTDLLAYADVTIGDVALAADDLSGANAKLCMFDGTNWKIVSELSTLTNLT